MDTKRCNLQKSYEHRDRETHADFGNVVNVRMINNMRSLMTSALRLQFAVCSSSCGRCSWHWALATGTHVCNGHEHERRDK